MRTKIKASSVCGICGLGFAPLDRSNERFIYSYHTDTFYHIEDRCPTSPPKQETETENNNMAAKTTKIKTKKNAVEAIYALLKRGPKGGLTISDIADRAGFSANTVRMSIATLVAEGVIKAVGSKKSGTRGRPSTLYSGKIA